MISPYIDTVLFNYCFGSLGLWVSKLNRKQNIAQPQLARVGDFASSSISHEHNQIESAVFQTLDDVFPKYSLFRLVWVGNERHTFSCLLELQQDILPFDTRLTFLCMLLIVRLCSLLIKININ